MRASIEDTLQGSLRASHLKTLLVVSIISFNDCLFDTVLETNASSANDDRSPDQLETLKESLTNEFEQLTRQINAEAQAEQVLDLLNRASSFKGLT